MAIIMDSVSLTTFLTVHEAGGITAAAKALGRTQSAISHRIAALETTIGAPLFERIGHRLILSEVGEVLIPYAIQMSAIAHDAQKASNAVIRGEMGSLKLAIVGTLASTPLTALLMDFRDQFPNHDLRIQTARSAEVSELVRRGDAAIGLRYFLDETEGVESKIVGREPLVIVCAHSHKHAGQTLRSLADLSKERWLTFSDHAHRTEPFAGTLFAQFHQLGVSDFDAVSIDSITAQKRMAEAGFGIALVQSSAVQEELARGDLRIIRIRQFDPKMPIASVVRKNGYQTEVGRWLLSRISDVVWSS